jgi:D-beta-D-heptose 7-phosphate kinase/D-beta-D-heptose 1-phosphate adenosyltransferase
MLTRKRAENIVKAFAGKKVLVIGDLMLDRYLSGSVHRISPEAPVPVVLVSGERTSPGGSANVASNIQSLGGQAIVVGIVGHDQAADDLTKALSSRGIRTDGIVACDWTRTTVKTRVVAERQQVVRIDYEDSPELAAYAKKDLCERVAQLARESDAIIIEDYGKGVISQEVIDAALAAAKKRKIRIGLDPKDNHELKLHGITLATPNYKEACMAARLKEIPLGKDPLSNKNLEQAGEILLKKWTPELLIITLGAQGMYLLSGTEKPQVIPTKAREVFDVSGAGDTVIATAILALVSGADHYESASIANHAAGIVVGKLGTATCSPDELVASVE